MIKTAIISFRLMLVMSLIFQVFTAEATDLPAFPGSEGYGRYTTGGRSVYNIAGKVVRSEIARSNAISGLPTGIYLIDRRKVKVQAR